MPAITHEQYIHKVKEAVLARIPEDVREKLSSVKMVYGCGDGRYRGITHYYAWKNGNPQAGEFIEIAATGEESPLQLAGTMIHELAHVLAGYGAGHGLGWKEAYQTLGLRNVLAAGHKYLWANFEPDLRAVLVSLPTPSDGNPNFRGNDLNPLSWLIGSGFKPCPLGIGTRGGRSRGKGSGSRLRLFQCECKKPVKARVASDTFNATCNYCNSLFKRVEKGEKDLWKS